MIKPGIERPVIPHKVQIAKEQPAHGWVSVIQRHRLKDLRQIPLMDDFIGLEVERPIAGAVGQRDVRLLRIDQAVLPQCFVPDRLHKADLRIADGANAFERAVVTASHVHDKFIHDRQNGPDRLHDGIIVTQGVPAKSEPADPHIILTPRETIREPCRSAFGGFRSAEAQSRHRHIATHTGRRTPSGYAPRPPPAHCIFSAEEWQ